MLLMGVINRTLPAMSLWQHSTLVTIPVAGTLICNLLYVIPFAAVEIK